MPIFYNIYTSYQIFINRFIQNLFSIKNDNEKSVSNISTQIIQHSQTNEPCRSCTDFKTFSRIRRQEFSQIQVLFFIVI